MEPVQRLSSRCLVATLLMMSLFCGFCLSAPVNNSTGYSCLLNTECENDTEAVFAVYKNESFCCRAGDAIIFSISGPGFEYSTSYYAEAFAKDGDSSTEASDEAEGGMVKRSTDSKKGSDSTPKITSKCMCKPRDLPDFDEIMDDTSISSFLKDVFDGLGGSSSDSSLSDDSDHDLDFDDF